MQSNTLRMMSSHLRSVLTALNYIQDIYSIYGIHMMLRFAPVRQRERIVRPVLGYELTVILRIFVFFLNHISVSSCLFLKSLKSSIRNFPKNNPGSRNRDRWSSRSSRNRAGAAASSSSACLNLRAEVDKLLCS
jgi:hypothetical protein